MKHRFDPIRFNVSKRSLCLS